MHLAVTVSSLGPRRANTGYVLVLDDLTEMLRSQKSAAWQEVARRIAHEIKNPLTPIQLSAQRLSRFLDRRETPDVPPVDPELTSLVQECSRLIEREVSTLAALVNEFSQFVRFPTAKLVSTDANTIVHEALEVFLQSPRRRHRSKPSSPKIFRPCAPMPDCSAVWSSI